MLKDAIKSIVQNSFSALDDLPVTGYYHQTGEMTFTPSTGVSSEAGAINAFSQTDIAAVASSNSLTSQTTDLTTYNITADTKYIKIAGFTESGNNGYSRVTSVGTNALVLDERDMQLIDEVLGDTIVLTGMFYKLTNAILLDQYTLSELMSQYQLKDAEAILDTDQKAMIPSLDLPVTPNMNDFIEINDVRWQIQAKKIDPAESLWILRIREI
ncbi:MAG: hypothetical protein AMK71_04125 [Nitrospira bacterium SG8_35_4]|nr:MAG: hypothetical protein AMK71_04125 [Nitrospira bacterium SG8_35_4]